MRKLFFFISIMISLLIIPGSCRENQTKSRSILLQNSLSITGIPSGAKKIEIWLPIPQKTSYQSVSGFKILASLPWKLETEKEYGNSFVHLSGRNPAGAVNIKYSVRVIRSEEKTDFKKPQKTSFYLDMKSRRLAMEGNRYVVINDKIRRIADETTANTRTAVEKARAIYNYVLNHMSYDKTFPGWGKGDSVRACEVGKGNCTDFHSLFMAMVRAKGLPASFEIGYPVPQNKNGMINGYHCWARIFLPSYGWVPVDISEAWKNRKMENYYFGSLTENRIMLSRGRDIYFGPAQKGGRLNYFVEPYIEVDGVPLINFKFIVEYKDI